MAPQPELCNSCGKALLAESQFCTYCGATRSLPPAPGIRGDSKMVYELKKIGIGSIMKLAFILNALLGLILGIFLASVGMSGMGMANLPIPMEGSPFIGAGIWIVMIVVLPLLYGLFGAIFGAIFGLLYNFTAWGVGGIRLTLKQS